MVIISKPLGAKTVVDYHKNELTAADQRYFREGEKNLVGEWHGKLAEHWGLTGAVDAKHYERMAVGRDPLTDEVLVQPRPVTETRPWIRRDDAWAAQLEKLFQAQGFDRTVLREVSNSEYRAAAPQPVAGSVEVPAPKTKRQAELIAVHAAAAQFYADQLASSAGETARQYLETERGIQETTWQAAGAGYAPKGDALWRQLQPQFSREVLEASGLFVRGRDHQPHDLFRDRIMFPISNVAGEIIAFGGRAMDGKAAGKYINSPETDIYRKREVLYGLHEAAGAQTGKIVLQEGSLDVWASRQADVMDAAALCGTALSENQARQLKGVASDVTLNLDQDQSGMKAAEESLDRLLKAGLRVRGVSLPDDAAAFAKQEGGAALKEKLEQPRPLIEWLAERARAKWNLGEPFDPQERFDAVRWVIGKLQQVPSDQRERIAIEVARYLKVELPKEAANPTHREHVAAWDMTFAPNKSYSAAAIVGGDHRIVDWHKAAVRKALDEGQKYAQARVGNGQPAETTMNWAVAMFLHDVSRPVDGAVPNPQVHTHNVMFNMTLAEDGRVRSMNPAEIFNVQSFMSAVYQSEVGHSALEGGYKLESGRNFSTRIKGFSKEYLTALSARTESIERAKAAAGLVGKEADERINLKLREPKQQWEPEALRKEYRKQAEEMGEKPWEVVAEARKRMGLRLSIEEKQRITHLAISYARDRLQEGQAVNDHFELMRDALRFGMGRIQIEDVKEAFETRGEFIQVDHYRKHAPGRRYTTLSMREQEAQLIERVLAGMNAAERISQVTQDEFRERYKTQVNKRGREFELNNGQLWAGYRTVTDPHQIVLVKGAAGSGKSESFRIIAEIARAEEFDVIGIAPTGGATNNLRKENIESYTVQAHIRRKVDSEAKRRLYLFDEGSLVGTRQAHTFMSLVRPQDRVVIAYDPRQHQSVEAGRIIEELERAGAPTYRLEKIERQRENPEMLEFTNKLKTGDTIGGLTDLNDQGRVFEEEDRHKRIAHMGRWYALHDDMILTAPDNRTIGELNIATRLAMRAQGRLGEDAIDVRTLVNVRDLREVDRQVASAYEEGNVVRWIKSSKELGVKAGDYATVSRVDTEKNLVTIQVPHKIIGYRNVTFNPNRFYGVEIFNEEKRVIAEGERVQLTRPWRVGNESIPNRSMATVEAIKADGTATLVFREDGRRIAWNPKQNPHVDYAYAVTSYSVQYATSDKVAIHVDTSDSRIRKLLDKAFIYVSGTRQKSDIRVFTDDIEALLEPATSPVQRIALKNTALGQTEIEGLSNRVKVA
jgi:DNA primase catalytic core